MWLPALMWLLHGDTMAERATRGTLTCTDTGGSLCAAGGGRYSLAVAPDRRPSLSQKLLRAIWPVILPFE